MHGQQFAGGAFEHVFRVGNRLEHGRPEMGQLRMALRDVLPSLGRQPHPHPVSRPRPRWFIVALLRVRDHSGTLSLARNECTCVPSCVELPAGDQGCPSGWYAASHGCRPAYRPARAGLWCLMRHLAHAEHAGGAAVDPPAAAGHGAGRPRGLLVRESGSSPTRSTFG